MSDRVNICPSCNYSGNSEANFQVCPQCGLIIAKYFQRARQYKPEPELNSSQAISSEKPFINCMLEIIAAVAIVALVLFISAVLVNKYVKVRNGTIIWTKEYYPNNSSSAPSFAHGMAIGNDFLYLVGSYGRSDTNTSQWSIQKRKTSDGTFTPEFGDRGLIKSAFGPREDYANGVALDSKYIYIIGMDRTPWGTDRTKRFDSQWRIEKRRLSDGSLTEQFGEGGVVTSDLTPYYEKPEAIIIVDNYMYVSGTEVIQEEDYQWRVEKRWLTDGSLVQDFGIGGVVRSYPNATKGYVGSQQVNGMAMSADYTYILGMTYNSAPTDTCWRIEKRRLGDGSLAKGFGTDGFVTSNPSLSKDEAFGIAIDSKSMFIVGYDTNTGNPLNTQWRIEKRSLSDGSLVREFGKDGIITNNNRLGKANGIVLEQEPGLWKKILNLNLSNNQSCMYVIGLDNDEKLKSHQWRIEKRNMNNGALCSEFGENGVVNIDPGVELRVARLIAADTDHIYVSGFRLGSNTSIIIKIKK